MVKPDKKTEDQKFNDTLKRMLETPPKPHEGKEKDADRSQRPPVLDQDIQNGGDAE